MELSCLDAMLMNSIGMVSSENERQHLIVCAEMAGSKGESGLSSQWEVEGDGEVDKVPKFAAIKRNGRGRGRAAWAWAWKMVANNRTSAKGWV